ncbi:MAG: sulfatase-like hydrolase/transferase [Haloferula sp.]
MSVKLTILSLALAIGPLPALADEDERPNVVIFFTDDQGTLDVNCYGSDDLITPHMDRIAAQGVRFTQAYAHVVCCPARAALLTGRHPQRSGITRWTQGDRHGKDSHNINMPAEEVTLAEVLKQAGYRTALFGKWHLGAKPGHGPLEQGFETFFGHLSGFIDNYRHYFLHGSGYHDLYDGNQEIFRPDEYYPDLMIHRALDYIEANREVPFFVTVSFNLPHYPEQPTETFKEAYADLPMPRQSYARVISSVDEHIGLVMDKLEELKLSENTIVIMMSDNGHSTEHSKGITRENHSSGYPVGHYYTAHGGGGNTGKWIGHKGKLLEGGIRVPAMISYPAKLPRGQVRNQIITVMDWFPTVLDLCDIDHPDELPQLDGHSVTPLIEDPEAQSLHQTLHFAWRNDWAIRRGEWKLIGNAAGQEATLHRLTDPQPEQIDYSNQQPELVTELTRLHQDWIEEVSPK